MYILWFSSNFLKNLLGNPKLLTWLYELYDVVTDGIHEHVQGGLRVHLLCCAQEVGGVPTPDPTLVHGSHDEGV